MNMVFLWRFSALLCGTRAICGTRSLESPAFLRFLKEYFGLYFKNNMLRYILFLVILDILVLGKYDKEILL